MEGNIGNLQPSPLHFSRSTYQQQQGKGRTEEALNRHGRSAFSNNSNEDNNDDNISLQSFATDVFFNDNLSQLSQEDYDYDNDDSLSDN